MNNCIYNSKVHSFPQALLSQNCPHLGTVNVHKQISMYTSVPNTSYFYIFLCKIEATVFLILQIFCNMHKKCLRTAYCLLWIFFLLSFLWYDFINKKKFPFLCNNHKMLCCLELNFKQRFMVVDMRFEN